MSAPGYFIWSHNFFPTLWATSVLWLVSISLSAHTYLSNENYTTTLLKITDRKEYALSPSTYLKHDLGPYSILAGTNEMP